MFGLNKLQLIIMAYHDPHLLIVLGESRTHCQTSLNRGSVGHSTGVSEGLHFWLLIPRFPRFAPSFALEFFGYFARSS